LRSPALARKIATLALTKKAMDVVIMDLRGLTAMTDYFVVCSGESDTQVKAIANAVEDGLEKMGSPLWHRERGSVNWILLDSVDVVLHVFHKNTRSFYNLEKLWGDAVLQRVEDKPRKTAGIRRPSVPRPVRKKRPSSSRKLAS